MSKIDTNDWESWDKPNIKTPEPKSVMIDGKLYTPQLGG